jgi:formate hydrogenlyase transcriptional activator
LNVFPILVPPLRERASDIALLVRYFTEKHARRLNKRITTIPAETMAALSRYRWPGNIRELENIVERAVLLSQGSILEVPIHDLSAVPPVRSERPGPADETLEAAEREHITQALKEADWVIGGPSGAAAKL